MYNMESNLVANVLSHPVTIIFGIVVITLVVIELIKQFKNK